MPFCEKNYRVLVIILLVLSLVVGLLKYNNIIGKPPEMPDIVFLCIMHDYKNHVHEITFIDRYGECYYSNDPYVCNGFDEIKDFIKAYKAGEIEDKIKLCGSCSSNEVMKRFRKMYRQVKNRNICIIPYGGLTIQMFYPNFDWYGLYFDESGEIRYVRIHDKRPGYEEVTNDRQVNQTYEWCNAIMGEKEGYGPLLP